MQADVTHRFEQILVHAFISKWLEMLLEPSRLSCTRTSAEDDKLEFVLFGEGNGACEKSIYTLIDVVTMPNTYLRPCCSSKVVTHVLKGRMCECKDEDLLQGRTLLES